MSSKKLWMLVGFLLIVAFGIAHGQQSGSTWWNVPTSAPLLQTITYVNKVPTTDFRGAGMGQHLMYFPAFGLTTPATNLRTDCTGVSDQSGVDGCIEVTPDFGNFKHHLGLDFSDRTFSPDAGGDPLGVKTAGGYSSWDVFTLPNGVSGLSGTTYDTHGCGNSTNFVNQIQLLNPDLHDFCLNIIVDNSASGYAPSVRLEARSDTAGVDLAAHPQYPDADGKPGRHPDYTFDGETDMYTFRYMGMSAGDKIKIRVAGPENSQQSPNACTGPGVAGIMVSHISTCMPEPGACSPKCEGKLCGDDGCGGSCGICPRADKLVDRKGTSSVRFLPNGTPTNPQDAETVVFLHEALTSFFDGLEESLREEFRKAMIHEANGADPISMNVRNFHLHVKPWIQIIVTAPTVANAPFHFEISLKEIRADFKLKPEGSNDGLGNFNVEVFVNWPKLTGNYDPVTGALTNVAGDAQGVNVNESGAGVLGGLTPILSDILNWNTINASAQVHDKIHSGVKDGLIDAIGTISESDLTSLNMPALAALPRQVQIGGIDIAQQIRDAIIHPPRDGSQMIFTFDASAPAITSGTDPIVRQTLSQLTARIYDDFEISASMAETRFPDILGEVESYRDTSDNYTTNGWACAEELGQSLEVGIFSDGELVQLGDADAFAEPAIANACKTPFFSDYRYWLTPTTTALGDANVWDNRLTVGAGLMIFEKEIGEVPRTVVNKWMEDTLSGVGNTFNQGSPERHFFADFNGDGRLDYMWEGDTAQQTVWWVALTKWTGDGFNAPANWLDQGDLPNNVSLFNANNPYRHFVADFNGDGLADYMWESNGWYVALANPSGTGFNPPTLWLAGSLSGIGNAFNNDGNPTRHRIGDFNGDGRADYMWEKDGSGDAWYVALANTSGTSFVAPTSAWLTGSSTFAVFNDQNPAWHFVADFNGDGKDDYMWEQGNNGWYVALANQYGTGFNAPIRWLHGTLPNIGHTYNSNDPKRHVVGYFNDDDRADYMWEYDGIEESQWLVALSNGNGFDAPKVWLDTKEAPNGHVFNDANPSRQFVADFDGDGLDDFMYEWNGWWVALSEGDDFSSPLLWLSDRSSPTSKTYNTSNPHRQVVGDFTGDGLPDLLWEYQDWYVADTLLPRQAPPPPGGGC